MLSKGCHNLVEDGGEASLLDVSEAGCEAQGPKRQEDARQGALSTT